MSPQEGQVLVAAVLLAFMVFVQGRKSALGPGLGLLLLALVAMATAAALLHLLVRMSK